jgi:hypothetical protein
LRQDAEGKAVAEDEQQVEFIPVKDSDIMAERTAMWDRFNQLSIIAIAAVAGLLVLMAIFLV